MLIQSGMNTKATPIKSLSHPLWGLSLAVLLANDHVLKGAGVLPSWMTGKLSDLAGYFLFPSLLATALRVQSRRGLIACHLAAAGLLFLTELSPAFCDWVLAVSGHRLWPDPTDLVALVSIVLSYVILAPLALRRESKQVATDRRRKVLLLLGTVATVATSPRRPPGEPVRIWDRSAEVFVENQRGQSLQVRVSAPKEGIQYDCKTALSRPSELFAATQFSVVRHVTLGAGDSLPLSEYNFNHPEGCNVVWIAAEGSPEYIAVWRSGTFVFGNSPTSASGRIVITQGKLEGPEGLSLVTPATEPQAPTAQCAAVDTSTEPAWSAALPTSGSHTLRSVVSGADGCDVLLLAQGTSEHRFTVCSEPVALPFVAGDSLRFDLPADGSDGLVISGQSGGKTVTLTLVRKALALTSQRMAPECPVVQRTCGAGEAVRVQVPTVLGLSQPLARGEQETIGMGAQTVAVYVRRAERVLLNDRACDVSGSLSLRASYITWSTR